MSRKSNATPDHYETVCIAPRGRRLIDLNIHLRAYKIDARYNSDNNEATLRVPPEQHHQATTLAVSYGHRNPLLELSFPL